MYVYLLKQESLFDSDAISSNCKTYANNISVSLEGGFFFVLLPETNMAFCLKFVSRIILFIFALTKEGLSIEGFF